MPRSTIKFAASVATSTTVPAEPARASLRSVDARLRRLHASGGAARIAARAARGSAATPGALDGSATLSVPGLALLPPLGDYTRASAPGVLAPSSFSSVGGSIVPGSRARRLRALQPHTSPQHKLEIAVTEPTK